MQTMNVSENASCNITLTCSVEGAEKAVQYSWTPRDPHASESSWGSTLTISWTPCDPDLQYTCTAKNPVSQSSSRPVHLRTWQICIGNWVHLGPPEDSRNSLSSCRIQTPRFWQDRDGVGRQEIRPEDPLFSTLRVLRETGRECGNSQGTVKLRGEQGRGREDRCRDPDCSLLGWECPWRLLRRAERGRGAWVCNRQS